jgi:hypothetical protein
MRTEWRQLDGWERVALALSALLLAGGTTLNLVGEQAGDWVIAIGGLVAIAVGLARLRKRGWGDDLGG